jgi:catechol 2,3-dioxygenase-like lactoylglutathione lyase family enzyme
MVTLPASAFTQCFRGAAVMLDHLELSVPDLPRSRSFYRAALAPLAYELRVDAQSSGFGVDSSSLDFWLRTGDAARPPPHFAFQCASRDIVHAAHVAALAAGGVDNGAPRLMPHIHPNYYAAFVRDPDGHNVEFVCHHAAAV